MINTIINILKELGSNIELFEVSAHKHTSGYHICYAYNNKIYNCTISNDIVCINVRTTNMGLGTSVRYKVNEKDRYMLLHLAEALLKECEQYTNFAFEDFANILPIPENEID